MSSPSRDSENRVVLGALTSTYCPALIQEARDRQDKLLTERFRGGSYTIADIGCGTGYHGLLFAPTCPAYHGFEIAPELAEMARRAWRKAGLDQAQVSLGDASEVELDDDLYDLVFCLYFTPGNFRDKSDDMSLYDDAYLDRNPVFVAIFSRFYRAMKQGGSMFLTIYKDVAEAEAAQIDYYHHTNQRVMTPEGSRFVATEEGFWSARWTRRSMLSNLDACGIDQSQVTFGDLNQISWLVEIRK